MAEFRDRPDSGDSPGDEPERGRPERFRPEEGREVDWNSPALRGREFDLDDRHEAELQRGPAMSRRDQADRPDDKPGAPSREHGEKPGEEQADGKQAKQPPERGDGEAADDRPAEREPPAEEPRPADAVDNADASSRADESDTAERDVNAPAAPPNEPPDDPPPRDVPAPDPESADRSRAGDYAGVRFGDLFADLQHSSFDMDRRGGVDSYRDDPLAREFSPSEYQEERSPEARQSLGDLIANPEADDASRYETLRNKFVRKGDEVVDATKKNSDLTWDSIRPPAGHATVGMPQAIPSPPHHGIDAGDTTTGFLVLGIVVAEGGRRLVRHLRGHGKGA